jgi:hypothetical protein
MFVPFYSATMLAFESCGVVGLRMAMLMTGSRECGAEMQLMMSEKIDAMFEATASLVAGGTPASVVDRYRQHVAANAERLAR